MIVNAESTNQSSTKTATTDTDTITIGPYVADPGTLTRRQACIWLPIAMFLIVLYATIAIYKIDDVKNRDTILYAKFIANIKDKQMWRGKRLSQ